MTLSGFQFLTGQCAARILTLLISFTALSGNAASSHELEAEIRRLAASQQLEVGVAAIHVQTGETIAVNGDKSYPLASTYKVPIAAYAFHLVEKGKLRLDQMIEVESSERMKWSPIYDTFSYPGVSLSLLNLIEPMMIHSDNTATDVVLNNIGGGKKVTHWLQESGVENLRVDRTTADLIRAYFGISQPENPQTGMGEQLDGFFSAHPELSQEVQAQNYANLDADPQDQGTPLAMAGLLKKLWSNKLLNEQHRTLLQEIMTRCETGKNRLSGKLPLHALPIAHKTGTIGGSVNDVGVINLPAGKGDIAVAVFTKHELGNSESGGAQAADVISDIGRAVYDYYLFQP